MITSKYIPFKGFTAINFFGLIIARRDDWDILPDVIKDAIIRHEKIHSAQGRELLWIGFYIAYIFEFLFNMIFGTHKAYDKISFEREAYAYEWDVDYLKNRKHFAQWR